MVKLYTERLTLRPFEEKDVSTLNKFIANEEVIHNALVTQRPFPTKMGKASVALHPEFKLEGENIFFAVELKASKELIGSANLAIESTREEGSVSYILGRDYWGIGFAEEIYQALISFGFDFWGLESIVAEVAQRNSVPRKALEQAGMTKEQLTSQLTWDNENLETVRYRIKRKEYEMRED